MDATSSVSSSNSGCSRGHASPAKKSDELTASHESDEESSGNSPDGTGRQRHADYTHPNVRQRNESRSLLHPASQSEKRGATDVKREIESKNLDTPRTVLTSTKPATNGCKPKLMPSLAPDGVRHKSPECMTPMIAHIAVPFALVTWPGFAMRTELQDWYRSLFGACKGMASAMRAGCCRGEDPDQSAATDSADSSEEEEDEVLANKDAGDPYKVDIDPDGETARGKDVTSRPDSVY